MSTLAQQGFRFVRRGAAFNWVHPAEVLAADQDCTAMGDAEFEDVVAQTEQQALAADRALNAAKATPAYYAPSDLFSLSQQNRGVL